MPNHNFNFAGGEYLRKIGASWLISYLYFEKVDPKHLNWQNVKTVTNRKNNYNKYKSYHSDWVRENVEMNVNKLKSNTMGISGADVITMAKNMISKGLI